MCSLRGKKGSQAGAALNDIERLFRSTSDPSRALGLCKQVEKQKLGKEESARLDLLSSEILRWSNRPHSALERARQAAKSTADPDTRARCLLMQGLINSDLRMAFTAIDIFDEALEKARKRSYRSLMAEILLAIGEAKSNAGLQNFAFENLEEALRVAEEDKLTRLLANIYAHRALCEFRRGNLEAARVEAEKGILVSETDPLGAAECYRGIAIIHSVSGRSALAIENYRKSLTYFRQIHFIPGLVREYLSLGDSYLKLGEVDMAEHFIRKALALAEEGENLPLTGVVYSRLGTLYLTQGDYGQALECFEKDRELSSSIENPSNIAHIHQNIGHCLSLIGDYPRATEALQNAAGQFAGVGDVMNGYLTELDLILAGILSATSPGRNAKDLGGRLARLSQAETDMQGEHPLASVRKLFVGACLAAHGDQWQEAEETMNQAVGILEQHLMPSDQAEMMFLFGRMAIEKDHRDKGAWWLRKALKVAETYTLNAMVKTIIDILGRFDEDILVDYSFEKQAARVVDDHTGEAGVTSATENMIGGSEAFLRVLSEAREAADTEATILLVGETGTGKELLARAIHRWSRRAGKKIVAVNCGAIPKELVESALFGHVKGAFTGAVSDQVGCMEAANGGSIFLDEITELPLGSQVKLLRFLEYKEIQPLGVAEARKVDVRVIASTNREPFQSVQNGTLREDLYYRISVIPIFLPRLEERGNDVIDIARHFVASLPLARRKEVTGMTPAAEAWLTKRSWPGNVRELNNVMLRAVVFTKGTRISVEDMEKSRRSPLSQREQFEKLDDLVNRHIMEAMRRCRGNQIKAAELLGIHRNTLRNKLGKLPPL